jgi:surface carbohydrate biosynthesis protein
MRFSLILKLFLHKRLIFNNPPKSDLVVFDCVSANELENIIKKYDYYILQVRPERIDKIYISLQLLKKIFKNYKGNIVTAYFVSILEVISPKVVITFIDRSYKFSDVAKILFNKMQFFAIQNGSTYHDVIKFNYFKKVGILKYNLKDRLFIPNYFCLGKFDVDNYKKNKIQVKNFFIVGGIRLANYLLNKKKKKLKVMYDICYLSDGCTVGQNDLLKKPGTEEAFAKSVKYFIKFCIDNKLKSIFVFKRFEGKLLDDEIFFYKKYLGKEEFDYLLKNSFKKTPGDYFKSYYVSEQSEVIISVSTTLLAELLGFGKKILSINLTPTNIYDFPIKGISFLKNASFNKFNNRLLKILRMSNKEYFSSLRMDNSYIYKFDKKRSSINQIQDIIDKYIYI